MKSRIFSCVLSLACLALGCAPFGALGSDAPEPADLIINNAKILTVNSDFATAQAIAIRGGQIVAVGKNRQVDRYKGPDTRVFDVKGKTVLPGLYDGDVHSYEAAVSELSGPAPEFQSLSDIHDYIVKQASQKPAGHWIIIRHVYPTRVAEHRLPTLEELDAAAPQNPLFWDCGFCSLVNTKAYEASGITNGTPDPAGGEIMVDILTSRRTGMLRNAASALKLPPEARITPRQRRDALKNLYALYNQQGITSIAERSACPDAVNLFHQMASSNELSVRINCSPTLKLGSTEEDSIAALNALTNCPKNGMPSGPTGVGDDWVRIGPLGVSVDGELGYGTAYLRTPYGIGPTFRIDEPAYCGIRLTDPVVFNAVYREAALRGWQLGGRCEGDAAVDALLNCYENASFKTNIAGGHFLIMQSALQPNGDWSRSINLGVGASIEPDLLYKDGASLSKILGEKRLHAFMPLKTWFDSGLVIGGGSGHVAGLDPRAGVTPWSPWLGMWITLTRQTEQGDVIHPEECLTREQAVRFYTRNNAWLTRDDASRGSLEPGKLADLIVIDRDILRCPVEDVKDTKVLLTVVGGKIVWQADVPAVADNWPSH
jgi:predicted amidohydrolase YtcJ